MFGWYRNAAVCYIYLSDVMWSADDAILDQQLRTSRWFTRGWTLQELIAPRNAEFYSADWRKIATKDQICTLLSSITGVDEKILKGAPLSDVSIARRMSWASHRKTTRIEDTAYCLFGIFDINLPLIYGEGHKAFRRLQEAIMTTTHDQSLFAWGRFVDHPSGLIDRELDLGFRPISWKPPEQRGLLLGLFATSPGDFRDSSEISPVDHGFAHELNRGRPPALVNGGVLIKLVIDEECLSTLYWDRPAIALPIKAEIAVLLCRVGNTGSSLIGFLLHLWGDDYCSRTDQIFRIDAFVSYCRFKRLTRTRHVIPYRQFQLRNGDIVIRWWKLLMRLDGVERPTTHSGPAWRQKWGIRVLRLEEDANGDEEITHFFERQKGEGLAITLRRVPTLTELTGNLLVGASPYVAVSTVNDGGMELPNWAPTHGTSFHNPAFHHVMKVPSDTWELEVEELPPVHVQVDRMLLDEGSSAIDVLDLFIGVWPQP